MKGDYMNNYTHEIYYEDVLPCTKRDFEKTKKKFKYIDKIIESITGEFKLITGTIYSRGYKMEDGFYDIYNKKTVTDAQMIKAIKCENLLKPKTKYLEK